MGGTVFLNWRANLRTLRIALAEYSEETFSQTFVDNSGRPLKMWRLRMSMTVAFLPRSSWLITDIRRYEIVSSSLAYPSRLVPKNPLREAIDWVNLGSALSRRRNISKWRRCFCKKTHPLTDGIKIHRICSVILRQGCRYLVKLFPSDFLYKSSLPTSSIYLPFNREILTRLFSSRRPAFFQSPVTCAFTTLFQSTSSNAKQQLLR